MDGSGVDAPPMHPRESAIADALLERLRQELHEFDERLQVRMDKWGGELLKAVAGASRRPSTCAARSAPLARAPTCLLGQHLPVPKETEQCISRKASSGEAAAAPAPKPQGALEAPAEDARTDDYSVVARAAKSWKRRISVDWKSGEHSARQSLRSFQSIRDSVLRRVSESRDTSSKARLWAQMLMEINGFESVCGIAIVASTVLVGAEVDYVALHGVGHWIFFVLNLCLNLFFVLEFAIRMLAVGAHSFFLETTDWRLNWFDCIMTIFSALDSGLELLQAADFSTEMRMFAALRVMRIFRTLRITRNLSQFRDFRKMLYAIQSSAYTFVWSLLLLVFTTYFFAICFTVGVTSASLDLDKSDASFLKREALFGTLSVSLYSLFLAMSQGVSWGAVAELLLNLHPGLFALFIAFISFMTFGVLNVVTSVFIEAAMSSRDHYKDLLMSEQEHEKAIKMRHIRQVFNQIDQDKSGEISLDEMEYFLETDDLRKYLEALDISPSDTRLLFKLIDTNDSGAVDIDEFCEGCLKLRGAAKSIDIHCMLFESRRALKRWSQLSELLDLRFEELHEHMSAQEIAASRQSGRLSDDPAGVCSGFAELAVRGPGADGSGSYVQV